MIENDAANLMTMFLNCWIIKINEESLRIRKIEKIFESFLISDEIIVFLEEGRSVTFVIHEINEEKIWIRISDKNEGDKPFWFRFLIQSLAVVDRAGKAPLTVH